MGKADKVLPAHTGSTGVNVGTTFGLTTIVIVLISAHCPEFGIKVYVVVVLLLRLGLQVPATPLVEIVGSGDNRSPLQISEIELKVGFLSDKISTFLVTESVQPQLVSTVSVTVYIPGDGYV